MDGDDLHQVPVGLQAQLGALVATGWTTTAVNGAPDLFVMLPFAAVGAATAPGTRANTVW